MSYDADCYCDELEEDEEQCVFCEMETGWALASLGKNLVIAGALCAAFKEGCLQTAAELIDYLNPSVLGRAPWYPGCKL